VTPEDTRERDALNALSNKIIACALRVHSELAAGLLESAYEACLTFELLQNQLHVERQVPVPLTYRGHRLDCGYRIDVRVDDCVIVEIKAVERLERVHSAQLLSHLKLRKLKLGLLINFNVVSLSQGIRRIVNGFPE